jgi:WD40 repeat protein
VSTFVHSIDTKHSDSGEFIISAGLDDGSVVIKHGKSDTLTVKLNGNDQDAITIVTLSDNGDSLFAADINGGFYQVSTKTGDFKKVDIKNDQAVICMKCCDDLLFIGLDSGTMHIFDNGVHIHKFSYSHSDWVRSISIIETEPDIFQVLSASQDQTVNLNCYNKKQNESTVKQIFNDHNALVYNVHWIDEAHFITSSMDGTMLVYKSEEDDVKSQFQESARTGQMHASNQHVGFWCAVSANSKIRAITYTGAFYEWGLNSDGSLTPTQLSKIGGHVGRSSVTDISWSPNGDYLLSCSSDQTTRGFTKNGEQFARPQVHGYDLTRVCHLTDTEFVSSAEEKELRVFRSTVWFKNDLEKFIGSSDIKGEFLEQNRASQPVLGLTNKDVGEENDNKINEITVFTEDSLSQDTLWPEHQKLYSHGNEVISCDVNYNLEDLVIASASRAKTANDAQICIWKRENQKHFKVTQKITCHNLTVTDLKFCGNFLISVGRDRTLGIHKIDEYGTFQTLCKLEKAQSRIIWSVDCVEVEGKLIIFTGSRDKSLCVWLFDPVHSKLDKICSKKADEAVTAVACKSCSDKVKVGVGYESGKMEFLEFFDGNFELVEHLQPHNGFVKRMSWKGGYLASCSEDGQVRIYSESL